MSTAMLKNDKEVWDENSTAMSLVTPVSGSAQLALAQLSEEQFNKLLLDTKRQQERMVTILKNLLVEGEDYGRLPHEKDSKDGRPFLREAGAEKIRLACGLVPSYDASLSIGDGVTTPPYTYSVKCRLHLGSQEGPVVGEGMGTCHPWEVKYRYIQSGRKCPSCGSEQVRIGKGKDGGPDYFYCWKKQGGCGDRFKIDDQRIASQTELGKRDNPDPYEKQHTCEHMAAKRAQVDAVTSSTATSGMFSRDIPLDEDGEETHSARPGNEVEARQEQQAEKKAPVNQQQQTPLQKEQAKQRSWKENQPQTQAQAQTRYPKADINAAIFRPDGVKTETEVEWDKAWAAIRRRYNEMPSDVRTLSAEELNVFRGRIGVNGWTDEVVDALLLANLGIGIGGIPCDPTRGAESTVRNLEAILGKLFSYRYISTDAWISSAGTPSLRGDVAFAADEVVEDGSGAYSEPEQIMFEDRPEVTTAPFGSLKVEPAKDKPTNEWSRARGAQSAGTILVNLADWGGFVERKPGNWSHREIESLIREHIECAPWELTVEAASVVAGIFSRFSSFDFGQDRIAACESMDQKACQSAMQALNLTIQKVESRSGPKGAASLKDVQGEVRIQIRCMSI